MRHKSEKLVSYVEKILSGDAAELRSSARTAKPLPEWGPSTLDAPLTSEGSRDMPEPSKFEVHANGIQVVFSCGLRQQPWLEFTTDHHCIVALLFRSDRKWVIFYVDERKFMTPFCQLDTMEYDPEFVYRMVLNVISTLETELG